MKRKDFFKVIGGASLAAAVGGCDFLDVAPTEKATLKDAFQNKDAAKDSLYSCYGYIPDLRDIGSVSKITADEVITPFTQKIVQHFPRGTYSPSNPVFPFWNNYYKGIRHCYVLLNRVASTPELPAAKIKDYKAQAKFMIGYYSWLLSRMYGPIIVQTALPDLATSVSKFKGRTPYEGTVEFIADMLDKAAKDLPATRSGNEYGLATSVAAKGVKARLLLYAASPLFNGGGENKNSFYADFKSKDGKQLIPATYDKKKWRKAADALKEAIDAAEAAGHSLYHYNASVDAKYPADPVEKNLRFTLCDRHEKETIFAVTRSEGQYDFQNNSEPFNAGTAWNGDGTTLRFVEYFYTENGLPIDKDPHFDYNDRYSIANGPNGTTMLLNLNREPRFNAWVCYHNSWYAIKNNGTHPGGDPDRILCKFRKYDNCGMQNRSNNYSPTGYLNMKGVHPFAVDETRTVQQYPWPLLRLGDLYLEYAEALIESEQSFGTAKHYIDKVRTRAGIPTVDDAWNPIGGANDKKTLRSIVRRERTIELYLENQRFWDLRRWMEADPYLNTKVKGMNIHGVTDADFFKIATVPQERAFHSPRNYLMPIPINQVNRDPNMVQNPGY